MHKFCQQYIFVLFNYDLNLFILIVSYITVPNIITINIGTITIPSPLSFPIAVCMLLHNNIANSNEISISNRSIVCFPILYKASAFLSVTLTG